MARNGVREQLLAEERARRRAASQKLRRLSNKGINTAGIDPRRSAADVSAMNTRQLRSHINRLNAFTDRSNGYVAGHNGAPMSLALWRQYQRAEKLNNANAQKFYESIKNLPIPGTGKTIQGRLDDIRSRDNAPREGDYRSFGAFERSAAGVTGNESLKKLLKAMNKRNDPNYLEREARLQRRILNKMLARTGNKDLLAKVRGMSDEEVITLAQYTDLMPTLESSYAMAKSTSSDTQRHQSSVYEDNEEKIHDLVDWAHHHFSDKEDSEQDTDDSHTPKRDRFGRFAGTGESKPDPTFARDAHGRFAKKRTPRFTHGAGDFNPDYS